MFRSKIAALITLVILIAIVITIAVLHAPWWFFIGLFFAYMSVFSNLVALLIESRNPYAARTLIKCTYIFAALFIASFIALAIVRLTVVR